MSTVPDAYRQPNKPLFFHPNELAVYKRMLAEAYRQIYPSIPVILIDREKTAVDPVLGEAPTKVWQEVVYIPGHVTWSPPEHLLGAFGIESRQEVLILFPSASLEAVGIKNSDAELPGAILVVNTEGSDETKQDLATSSHRQPQDAWGLSGDILNVAVTVVPRPQRSIESRDDVPYYSDPLGGL